MSASLAIFAGMLLSFHSLRSEVNLSYTFWQAWGQGCKQDGQRLVQHS